MEAFNKLWFDENSLPRVAVARVPRIAVSKGYSENFLKNPRNTSLVACKLQIDGE